MIYTPREDSFLLKKYVLFYAQGKRVLDVGTGSGIQALAAKDSGALKVLALDIDEEAVKKVNALGIECIKSDLFEKIKERFDLIVFNPPYLPKNKIEDLESARITSGGLKGDEIIIRFLKQSKKHLGENGKILIVLSSLTPRKRILELLKKQKWNYKILETQNYFMESLEVWEIERS